MARTVGPDTDSADVQPLDPEATVALLARIRDGDQEAMNRLLERCLPRLRRWAHGRLPPFARDVFDTADIVQDTVVRALRRLEMFEVRHEGALQAYLRQALQSQILNVIRNRKRRPESAELPEELPDALESPLEQAIGAENLARYEAALSSLRDEDREAIVARLEFQYSYEDLAVALGKPTANAARVAVVRALQRLARELNGA